MTNSESPAGGMTDTAQTLLPCPFDGGKARPMIGGGWHRVICSTCGTMSPITLNVNDAATAARLWNTRSPDPLKEAVVEAAMNWRHPPNAFKDYLAVENAEHELRIAVENYQRALATTDKGPDSGGSIDPAQS